MSDLQKSGEAIVRVKNETMTVDESVKWVSKLQQIKISLGLAIVAIFASFGLSVLNAVMQPGLDTYLGIILNVIAMVAGYFAFTRVIRIRCGG